MCVLSEAGHLEVGPVEGAGEGGALQEVPLAVGQPQRPRFGDAEVHQSEGPQVAAECEVGVGLAGNRRQRAHLLVHAALAECVFGALSGSPRFLILEGSPGIGKSALLSAAAETAEAAGARVLRAWANAGESDLPLGVAGQLFELALDGASEEERRTWLRGAAGPASRILNVDGHAVPADRRLDGHTASRALYWLTANAARHVPLVLVVDDLQWADPDSLRWLIHLSRRMKRLPLAVVAALAPDMPDSISWLVALLGAAVERLPLSGLDTASVARLVAQRCGVPPADGLAERRPRPRVPSTRSGRPARSTSDAPPRPSWPTNWCIPPGRSVRTGRWRRCGRAPSTEAGARGFPRSAASSTRCWRISPPNDRR